MATLPDSPRLWRLSLIYLDYGSSPRLSQTMTALWQQFSTWFRSENCHQIRDGSPVMKEEVEATRKGFWAE
jgi:hypothetical protein